ncbi:MAG: hypothetical protein U0166_05790 [Acidobacteriota bacterium]
MDYADAPRCRRDTRDGGGEQHLLARPEIVAVETARRKVRVDEGEIACSATRR